MHLIFFFLFQMLNMSEIMEHFLESGLLQLVQCPLGSSTLSHIVAHCGTLLQMVGVPTVLRQNNCIVLIYTCEQMHM